MAKVARGSRLQSAGPGSLAGSACAAALSQLECVVRGRHCVLNLSICILHLQFAWAAPELLLGARCTEKVDVSACSPALSLPALLHHLLAEHWSDTCFMLRSWL